MATTLTMPENKNFEVGTVYQGVVAWFREDKGYGFIEVHGKGQMFVHYSCIKGWSKQTPKNLHKGDKVEFRAGRSRTSGRMEAKDVACITSQMN